MWGHWIAGDPLGWEWKGAYVRAASKTRKTPQVDLPSCSSKVRPATSNSFHGPAFPIGSITHLAGYGNPPLSFTPEAGWFFCLLEKVSGETPRKERRARRSQAGLSGEQLQHLRLLPRPHFFCPPSPPLQPGSVPLVCQHLKLASKLSPAGVALGAGRVEYPAWRGGRRRENNSELGVFVGQKCFFHPAGNFHPRRFFCRILSWISPYTNLPPPQGSPAAVSTKQLQNLLT